MRKLCTHCKNLHIIKVQLKSDNTKPIRAGVCKKYHCTLQPTNNSFAPNRICVKEDGFEDEE